VVRAGVGCTVWVVRSCWGSAGGRGGLWPESTPGSSGGRTATRSQTSIKVSVRGCDVFHVDGGGDRRRPCAFRDGRREQIHRTGAVGVGAFGQHFPAGGNAGSNGLDCDDWRGI